MSPTQPSEQRECPQGFSYPECTCNGHSHYDCNQECTKKKCGCECHAPDPEPSPEQDWRRKISSIIPQFYSGAVGIVEFESFVDKIKSIVATEKAKSYEAGQRDKVVEVRQQVENFKYEGIPAPHTDERYYNDTLDDVLVSLPSLHLPTEESKK